MDSLLYLLGRAQDALPTAVAERISKDAIANAKPWQLALGAVAGLGVLKVLFGRRRINSKYT